jgi:hypothetical protein
MADGYLFGWNSSIFPLSPAASLTDPVTNTILRYFQNIIKINLGQAFALDAAACGYLNQQMNFVVDGNMVPQALAYPPDSTLTTTNYKFPLIYCHRLSREFQQFTDMKLMIKSEYVIGFILPPLDNIQYNYLYKYLAYVSDVLVQRSWQGYDPNYNNSEQVWITAKIAYALLNKDEYGSFLGTDGKTEFPGIRFHMSVMEESQFVESNYSEMENIFVQTNVYDGYNLSLPVDNFADGYVNPNLSIIGLNVVSGSVNGGTVIEVVGDGFLNITPSQVASFAVTLNGAPVNRIVVKTNQVILALSGPGPSTGTGNVVITDRLGNVATLTNGWTYT